MELLSRIKAMSRKEKMTAIGLCGVTVLTLLAVILIVSLFASGTKPTEQTRPGETDLPSQSSTATVQTTAPEQETTAPVENTTAATETSAPDQQDEDPQVTPSGEAGKVDISSVITGDGETNDRTFGIDVSKYQGTIDWAQVADYGVEFAIIRVGYRTKVDGQIVADSNARYNLQEAQKHGIKLGAYFFSTAISEAEAIEEANWVADFVSQYAITYPVAYNCEGFSDPENRQHALTVAQRTELALAFLKTVHQRGYVPMFYAAKVELEGQDAQWDTDRIQKQYKIWVAQYPAQPYPQTQSSSYSGIHHMWQFTPAGSVPGIAQGVDINIAYFGYEDSEAPKDDTPPQTVAPDPEALMTFTAVNETVTAKIETNLRDVPSQGEESTVLYTLKNGETAIRTGISDSGWSRVEWGGKTCYAVSSYLTTDLNYAPPEETQSAFQTQFTAVNEQVTAKDAVNLRDIPSMENSQVIHQLVKGEIAIRTGINNDVGWSRVEWNGQVLYCISSYLMSPTEETTPAETTASTEPLPSE